MHNLQAWRKSLKKQLIDKGVVFFNVKTKDPKI